MRRWRKPSERKQAKTWLSPCRLLWQLLRQERLNRASLVSEFVVLPRLEQLLPYYTVTATWGLFSFRQAGAGEMAGDSPDPTCNRITSTALLPKAVSWSVAFFAEQSHRHQQKEPCRNKLQKDSKRQFSWLLPEDLLNKSKKLEHLSLYLFVVTNQAPVVAVGSPCRLNPLCSFL